MVGRSIPGNTPPITVHPYNFRPALTIFYTTFGFVDPYIRVASLQLANYTLIYN